MDMSELVYRQEAPYPEILRDLIYRLRYRPGWRFELKDWMRDKDHGRGASVGLTFIVHTLGYNSYHPDRGQHYGVSHYFPVPPATYDERSWRRWLLNRLIEIEIHEACEFFVIELAHKPGEDPIYDHPYAPSHGPGNDPYLIREIGTEIDRRTRFTGEVLGD